MKTVLFALSSLNYLLLFFGVFLNLFKLQVFVNGLRDQIILFTLAFFTLFLIGFSIWIIKKFEKVLFVKFNLLPLFCALIIYALGIILTFSGGPIIGI